MIHQLAAVSIRKTYSIIADFLEVVNNWEVFKFSINIPGGDSDATASVFGELWMEILEEFSDGLVAFVDDFLKGLVVGDCGEGLAQVGFTDDGVDAGAPFVFGCVCPGEFLYLGCYVIGLAKPV